MISRLELLADLNLVTGCGCPNCGWQKLDGIVAGIERGLMYFEIDGDACIGVRAMAEGKLLLRPALPTATA